MFWRLPDAAFKKTGWPQVEVASLLCGPWNGKIFGVLQCRRTYKIIVGGVAHLLKRKAFVLGSRLGICGVGIMHLQKINKT